MTPSEKFSAQIRRESQAKFRTGIAEQAKRDYLDHEICHCPEPLRDGVYLGVWRCKLCGALIK